MRVVVTGGLGFIGKLAVVMGTASAFYYTMDALYSDVSYFDAHERDTKSDLYHTALELILCSSLSLFLSFILCVQ